MRLPFGFTLSRAIKQATTANSADIPENDSYWRPVGGLRDGTRDLSPADRAKALETVSIQIEKDGLVSRMTQQIREWCVGDGVTLASRLKDDAAREEHEEALALVWAEPQTAWEDFGGEIAETLAPVGELLVTLYPPPKSGPSAFGVLPPESIDEVRLNRHNARQTVGVLLKRPASLADPTFLFSGEFRSWTEGNPKGAAAAGFASIPEMGGTIELDNGQQGKIRAKVGPDCAYFPWRRRLGATRGLSMFYPVSDLVEALDAAIFQQVEGVAARNAWALWLKAQGATPAEAQKMAKDAAKQMGKGGGHYGTNQNVEMQVLAPDLGAQSFDTHLTTMLKIVSAETGWPITWLGLGTDAGNASTTELAGPALKMMRLHQSAIAKVIRTLVTYAMKRMPRPSSISEEDWLDFEVQLPEIGGRDMVRDSAALGQTAVAIDAGRGWAYTDSKAGEMVRRAFNKVTGDEFSAEDIPEEMPETDAADTSVPPKDDEDPGDEQAKKEAEEMEAMRKRGMKQSRRKARV